MDEIEYVALLKEITELLAAINAKLRYLDAQVDFLWQEISTEQVSVSKDKLS